MEIRPAWAILAGLLLGGAAYWWLARDAPDQNPDQAGRARAESAAAQAEAARPVLYRWRDDAGRLQVTQEPPKGRRYERIDVQPRDGIEVHGDRP